MITARGHVHIIMGKPFKPLFTPKKLRKYKYVKKEVKFSLSDCGLSNYIFIFNNISDASITCDIICDRACGYSDSTICYISGVIPTITVGGV